MYEKELNIVQALYGIGRRSRLQDLMASADGWDGKDAKKLQPGAIDFFMAFTERFGKLADDLAMFLDYEGSLLVGWSYWINDPARQRRGGLTRRIDLRFSADGVSYSRAEFDDDWIETDMASEALIHLIKQYRSYQPPGKTA